VADSGQSRPALQAVLLDALGTLLDLDPPGPRLQAELASRFGLAVTLEEAERAIAAEIVYYRAHLDQGRDVRDLAELRLRCAAVLAQELEDILGRSVPTGQAMVGVLLASLSFRPFPDVSPAPGKLHGRGLGLVGVSNWDIALRGVLDRLGLGAWLDGVVTSAEVGARKPDPAVFERGLAIAGVDASAAVHVGDSPREDVEGARQAGIEPILISRGEPRPPPAPVGGCRIIGSLRALVSVADGRRASDLL